jgi:uncharacterized membrane protein YdjX (TVP38/TMEM64 family)
MKLWQTMIIYLTAIVTFFIFRNEITSWMLDSRPPIFVVFLVATCFILFPVLPFKIVIGSLGFMYGPLLGAFISWCAASIGSVIIYLLVRTYFHKQGRAYLSKFDKLEKLQQSMEKRPFLVIFLARLIPILPQAIVNIYPAFLNIRLLTYAVASALGKIPAMLVYAFLGSSIFSNMNSSLIVIGIYALFLTIIYLVYRWWLKALL